MDLEGSLTASEDRLPRIVELLKANHLDDVLVFAGGIIPDEDIPVLKSHGICGVFGPGANTDEVVKFVREQVENRQGDKVTR